MSLKQPALATLSVDALGQSKFADNGVRLAQPAGVSYVVQQPASAGLVVEYRRPETHASVEPGWRIEAVDRTLRLTSRWSDSEHPDALVLEFDPHLCHATLLGKCREDGSIELPAVLHLPGQGSLRIHSGSTPGRSLLFDARRAGDGYIKITFPGATAERTGS